jgi:hypothetical protein
MHRISWRYPFQCMTHHGYYILSNELIPSSLHLSTLWLMCGPIIGICVVIGQSSKNCLITWNITITISGSSKYSITLPPQHPSTSNLVLSILKPTGYILDAAHMTFGYIMVLYASLLAPSLLANLDVFFCNCWWSGCENGHVILWHGALRINFHSNVAAKEDSLITHHRAISYVIWTICHMNYMHHWIIPPMMKNRRNLTEYKRSTP